MLFCQDGRELNCDSCLELSYEFCSPISVQTDLTPANIFFLNIIDKFNNRYVQEVTINLDGTFDIDMTLLPENYFNPYGGKFEIYLSTTDEGLDYIEFKPSYNCAIITITVNPDSDCC